MFGYKFGNGFKERKTIRSMHSVNAYSRIIYNRYMKKKEKKKQISKLITFLIFISISLFFLFSFFNLFFNSDKELAKSLVGIWQDKPVKTADWSNRYHFFSDGRYEYVTSEFDCGVTRERQHSGDWTINNGIFKLNTTLSLMWTGGEYVDGTAPCQGKELINYDVTFYPVEDIGSELESHHNGIKLKFTNDDSSEDPKLKFNLDGKDFWKFSDNPEDDSPAPIGSWVKADDYYE